MPDLRCTKLCKALLQTGECNDKSCTYAHNKEELRSTGAFQRTKLCRNLQYGRCPRGDKCNFAHSEAELQAPKTIQQGLKMLPPGLSMDYDGDEQSTQVSGSGSGDSNSSDNGSVTASMTSMLEPAYVHVGPPPPLPDPKAFRRRAAPMQRQKVVGPQNVLRDVNDPIQDYMDSLADSDSNIREYLRVMEELDRRTKMMIAQQQYTTLSM